MNFNRQPLSINNNTFINCVENEAGIKYYLPCVSLNVCMENSVHKIVLSLLASYTPYRPI